MKQDLEQHLQRLLKRCVFFQLSVREGQPALGVLVQARDLRDKLDTCIMLLERDTAEFIQTTSLDEQTEHQLTAWLLGDTDANTDPYDP